MESTLQMPHDMPRGRQQRSPAVRPRQLPTGLNQYPPPPYVPKQESQIQLFRPYRQQQQQQRRGQEPIYDIAAASSDSSPECGRPMPVARSVSPRSTKADVVRVEVTSVRRTKSARRIEDEGGNSDERVYRLLARNPSACLDNCQVPSSSSQPSSGSRQELRQTSAALLSDLNTAQRLTDELSSKLAARRRRVEEEEEMARAFDRRPEDGRNVVETVDDVIRHVDSRGCRDPDVLQSWAPPQQQQQQDASATRSSSMIEMSVFSSSTALDKDLELERLRHALDSAQQCNLRLNAQLGSLATNGAGSVKKEIVELKKQLKERTTDVEQLRRRLEKAERDRELAEQRARSGLPPNVVQLAAEKRELVMQLDREQSEKQELFLQMNTLIAQVAELQRDATNNDSRRHLEIENEELKKRMHEITAQYDRDLAGARTAQSQLELSKATWDLERRKLTDKSDKLEEDLKLKSAALQSLQLAKQTSDAAAVDARELDRLRSELEETRARENEVERRLRAAEGEKSQHKGSVDRLEEELVRRNKEIEDTKLALRKELMEREEARRRADKEGKEVAELREKVDRLELATREHKHEANERRDAERKIEELERRLEEMTARHAQRESVSDELKTLVQSLKEERERNEASTAEISRLHAQLRDRRDESEQLAEQVVHLQRELEDEQQRLADLRETQGASHLEEIAEKERELEKTRQVAQEREKHLEKELRKEMEEKRLGHAVEMEMIKKYVDELKAERERHLDELRRRKDEMERMEERISESTSASASADQIADLKSRLAEREEELEEARTLEKKKTDETAAIRLQLANKEHEVETLKGRETELQEEGAVLKDRVESLARELDQAKEEKKMHLDDEQQLREKLAEKDRELDEANQRKVELSERDKSLLQELDDEKARVRELSDAKTTLSVQLASLQTHEIELESLLEAERSAHKKLQDEKTELSAMLEVAEKKSQTLENEHKSVKLELGAVQAKHSEHSDRGDTLQRELAEEKLRHEQAIAEKAELAIQLATLERENADRGDTLQRELAEEKLRHEQAIAEKAELSIQLAAFERERSELETTLETEKQTRERLEAENARLVGQSETAAQADNDKLKALGATLDEVQAKYQKLVVEKAEFVGKLAEAEKRQKDLAATEQSLRQELDEARETQQQLIVEKAELTARLANDDDDSEKAGQSSDDEEAEERNRKMSELTAENARLAGELLRADAKFDQRLRDAEKVLRIDFEKQLAASTSSGPSLDEMEQLEARLDSLLNEKAAAEEEALRREDELERRYKAEIAAVKEVVDKATTQRVTALATMREERAELQRVRDDNDRLREEIQRLKSSGATASTSASMQAGLNNNPKRHLSTLSALTVDAMSERSLTPDDELDEKELRTRLQRERRLVAVLRRKVLKLTVNQPPASSSPNASGSTLTPIGAGGRRRTSNVMQS